MSTTATLLYFAHYATDISLFGGIKIASVALFVYYVCTKTRVTAMIGNLFPSSNANYRSSALKLNSFSNDILITLRSTKTMRTEKKPPSILAQSAGIRNMLETTPHVTSKPFKGVFHLGKLAPYLMQSVCVKKFKFTQVLPFVAKDPALEIAIKQSAEKIRREEAESKEPNEDKNDNNYMSILKRERKRAKRILYDMGSTLCNWLLVVTSYLTYHLLQRFMPSVSFDIKQVEMLQRIAASKPDTPMVFVPLHRSHLDYILVTFILTNNDLRAPLVAAGDNLNICVFGKLLRKLGAFYIKRKIDPVEGKKDLVYRAALQLYVTHALKLGHNMEFFIEGGRTRTGKPCMPKGGLLSVIVNAHMDGNLPDVSIVPVSINYERLVDGNFVCEQRGEKKAPETFWKALTGIFNAFYDHYGQMRIDFNEPYSLKELVSTHSALPRNGNGNKTPRMLHHKMSTSSLFGTDLVCEEDRQLVDDISRLIVHDATAATSVMSTNALAFLLLNQYRQGVLDKQLAASLDELRMMLKDKKQLSFAGDSIHVIHYACDLLEPALITREYNADGSAYIKINPSIDSHIELAYYANTILPYFAPQSILLITLHRMLAESKAANNANDEKPGVVRSKLIDAALDLCELLRYEFILHKPTETLTAALERTIELLCLYGYVKLSEETECESAIDSRRIARGLVNNCFDDSGDDDYDNIVHAVAQLKPDLFLASETLDQQRNLCAVLAPLASTYVAVVSSLQKLYGNAMLESDFIMSVMRDETEKVNEGICIYAESLSTDTMRNCLKVLEKLAVINISAVTGERTIALNRPYASADGKRLETIIQRISTIMPQLNDGYLSEANSINSS